MWIFIVSSAQTQKPWWQKHKYFVCFLDLLLRPTSRAKFNKLVAVHHIHDNSVAILSEEIHDRSHLKCKSLTLWVIARVEEFRTY